MPSLTQDEARDRARLISVISYEIDLTLSTERTYRSRTTVTFGCREPGASTFAELADAVSAEATLNGVAVERSSDGRIALPDLAAENVLVVDAELRTGTDGDAMHRYVDPADGETYLCAFLGGDVAHRVFACFDQPDLKASIALTVSAPEEWTVLGNGRLVGQDGERRTFAPTPPVSTYLFVVCAGPFASLRWEHAGLPFAWHARRSLADALERDGEELRRITDAFFDHYAQAFDEPYAFDSYDQVMAPGLNWGALETPGCVTFRDEFLPSSPPSVAERRGRAMVVAHEMAHMWFGDLVTPLWWEDIWLNESFADYMGFEVAHDHAGLGATLPEFTLGRAQMGYAADRRRSTHPVAPESGSVHDADAGFEATDQITYAKGNAVVRQLATWLGPEDFLRGVNAYLSGHRFGNAELSDFLDALAGATDRDVRGWAEAWLRTTGFDTLRVRRVGDGVRLVREGSRPHRVQVRLDDEVRWVDVDGEVPLPAARAVLPDVGGQTYAAIRPDEGSWAALWTEPAALPVQERSVLWATALDLATTGERPVTEVLGLAADHLPAETDGSVWEHVTERLLWLLAPLTTGAATVSAREQLAATARATTNPDLATAAARVVARCSTDPDELEDRLARAGDDVGLRWLLLARLAELGALDPVRIDQEAGRRPSTVAVTGAARARAALPTAQAKADAWELFADDEVDNRVFLAVAEGLWVPEHADLSAPYVDRYLEAAPGWARRRGQGFSREVGSAFPRHAATAGTVARLREVLAGDVPSVLARAWNDRLDDLEQSLAVRERYPAL